MRVTCAALTADCCGSCHDDRDEFGYSMCEDWIGPSQAPRHEAEVCCSAHQVLENMKQAHGERVAWARAIRGQRQVEALRERVEALEGER